MSVPATLLESQHVALSSNFIISSTENKESGPDFDQPKEPLPDPGSQLHIEESREMGPNGGPGHVVELLASAPAAHLDKNEELVIKTIRVTNVALGLRRIPAAFYTVIHHSNLQWTTESKPSSTNHDVVEWSDPVPVPSDPSTTVSLDIYASSEFKPMLGSGEHLRTLVVRVEQLLDRSVNDTPFTFFTKEGDVVSPCSSISVTVRRRECQRSDSLGPHPLCPITPPRADLEEATDQGHSALSRYRTHSEKQDLERAVESFQLALDICPLDHPCRSAAQSNLAMTTFILSRVEDTDASLEVVLELYHNALAARPVGHPDRSSTLIQLATVHLSQFWRRADEVEQACATALIHEVMELSSAGSYEMRAAAFILQLLTTVPEMHTAQEDGQLWSGQGQALRLPNEDLLDLSDQLLERFRRFGLLSDLQHAITALEAMVTSTPAWHDQYSEGLADLGIALSLRFDRLGEFSDLEGSIQRLRQAVDLTPRDHSDMPYRLNSLGISLSGRFRRLGQLSDLDDAISVLKYSIDLTPHGHPDKQCRLSNLGTSYIIRFKHSGELNDLECAIGTLRNTADLIPDGHPDKPTCMSNLGNCFQTRFERFGEMGDLEKAISMFKDSVRYIPDDHPLRPGFLNNLAISLATRFRRLGELSDLEEAISTLRDAINLTPVHHTDKPSRLNNLGNLLEQRFQRLGIPSDLDSAISTLKEAINLTPHIHPNKAYRLLNLGSSLRIRFGRLGELRDLENAISILREAVDLTPHKHPERPSRLNALGNSLKARFDRLWDLTDLEDAHSLLKGAIDLFPHGHPDKPRCLNDLGNSYRARFKRLGELHDLESAISTFQDAITLTPHDNPQKAYLLVNLSISLRDRFKHTDEPQDLEDAVSTARDALGLTPGGHIHMPGCLVSLANSLNARYVHSGELNDLEDAIHRLKDAIGLIPQGHPDRPRYLTTLGITILAHFEHLEELCDLEKAILVLREAADLNPDGQPERSAILVNLANSLRARFVHLGEPSDLEEAITLYSHAASTSMGPVNVRFDASQKWISCGRHVQHHSLLQAYSASISLLPQLAWIGLSFAHRFAQLSQGADVVREAAAMALDSGFPETAVEWLEQGRSIVWGELFRLRDSYEELSSVHPDHARRLRDLSAALELAGANREQSFPEWTHSSGLLVTESLQQEATRYRKLAIERDRLVEEIRALPGFERFLLHKTFSQLRAFAHSGPVVMLNAAEGRCDALIVRANVDQVVHVWLPKFTLKRSTDFQNMVKNFVRVLRHDDRVGQSVASEGVSWETILSPLWKCIVKPVLDALEISTPGVRPRIFWCPTGPFAFLPIHAAGLYDAEYSEPGHKVYDFVVSSYVPTLSILAQSSSSLASATPSSDLRLLAVRQPPSDEVLDLMKKADWAHFACHGVQDGVDSGLCLADGRRLRLRDILALSRPHGGLAFLSACRTATGEKHLSDEAIHLAAGMLFAGYSGVVGTMWAISDKLAPLVAKDVYEGLFRNGTGPDCREAARALQDAVERLRKDEHVSFAEWLPFIHVGL